MWMVLILFFLQACAQSPAESIVIKDPMDGFLMEESSVLEACVINE